MGFFNPQIMLSASQSLHLSSHEHIALTSQKQISITSEDRFITSVVNGIRAFSQKAGVKVYAGKDDIELQAQDGKLEAIARKDVQVISTEGGIEVVSPNVVSIKVGGTELKITPEGVFITTPGVFRVKAGEHVFEGGGKVPLKFPELPSVGPFMKKFHFFSLEGEAISNAIVKVFDSQAKKILWEGKTDSSGIAEYSGKEDQEDYAAIIGFDQWSDIFEDDVEEEDEELDFGEHGPQTDLDNELEVVSKEENESE